MEAAASKGSREAEEKENSEGDRLRDPGGGLDGEAAEVCSVAQGQVQGGGGEFAGAKEVGGGRCSCQLGPTRTRRTKRRTESLSVLPQSLTKLGPSLGRKLVFGRTPGRMRRHVGAPHMSVWTKSNLAGPFAPGCCALTLDR